MGPSRWRRSTHVMLAAAVIALIAVVVAVVAVFATGGDTSNAQVPAARPPAVASAARQLVPPPSMPSTKATPIPPRHDNTNKIPIAKR